MNLFIDTSASNCLVGLEKDGEIKSYGWQYNDLTLELIANIEKLLADNETTIKNLTKIAICHGPGSYTGSRIGVAVANALSYSLKIPIYAYDSGQEFSQISQKISQGKIKPVNIAQVKYLSPAFKKV